MGLERKVLGKTGSSSHRGISLQWWPLSISLWSVLTFILLVSLAGLFYFLGFWLFLYSVHILPCLQNLSLFLTPCLGSPSQHVSTSLSVCVSLG